MKRGRLWPEPSLLGKFALASLVPIVCLGLVLGYSLRRQIERNAHEKARDVAVLTSHVGLEPLLTRANLERSLTPEHRGKLDEALSNPAVRQQLVRVKIWNRAGRVVYSDAKQILGRRFPLSEELVEALAGRVVSEVSTLGGAENVAEANMGFERLLEVYVPLRVQPSAKPIGVLELYLPYEPIAASIERDTHTAYLLLLGGLGLLYAVLYRIVASASRRLRRQADENQHQALHDALTGLPNRTLFQDRIQQALLAATRDGTHAAIMMIDLDRFKDVNDTLGHQSGDLLLRALGPRLGHALRASDTVARLGGDEFGVLLPRVESAQASIRVAEKLLAALGQTFNLDGLALEMEASIGIALYPEHGGDADTLLRRADVAMYLAKNGELDIEVYAPERDSYSPNRLGLLGELRRALEQEELVLHYQPKASLQSGEVRSVEALVRWQHPARGLLRPTEFIPLAEHTGLMRPLTLYVIDRALKQCHEWQEQGLSLDLSVNLSGRDLVHAGLPDDVEALLDRWKVDPTRLELEVTESTILADPPRARVVLTRLSQLGVRIAIDDFGSGYSSLGYLKRLPADVLKIDKSFVLGMDVDEQDEVIVRSAIDLGHNLGLEVVAEGVGTAEIWRRLTELGCDRAQGVHLAAPMPADALVSWLESASAVGVLRRRGVPSDGEAVTCSDALDSSVVPTGAARERSAPFGRCASSTRPRATSTP